MCEKIESQSNDFMIISLTMGKKTGTESSFVDKLEKKKINFKKFNLKLIGNLKENVRKSYDQSTTV